MTLQNRVLPDGSIIATAARGTMLGNRGGCFHRADQTLRPRHWASRQWICCRLHFKGRRRTVMSPGLYTELFFLDEATALAAGHRPCFECRREDAEQFGSLWSQATGSGRRPTAPEMDEILHAERLDREGRKATHSERAAALPDGAIVRVAESGGTQSFVLLSHNAAWEWSLDGYRLARPLVGPVDVLTPPTIVHILRAGYRPQLHESLPERT